MIVPWTTRLQFLVVCTRKYKYKGEFWLLIYGCPSDNCISIFACPVTFLLVPGTRTTKISNAAYKYYISIKHRCILWIILLSNLSVIPILLVSYTITCIIFSHGALNCTFKSASSLHKFDDYFTIQSVTWTYKNILHLRRKIIWSRLVSATTTPSVVEGSVDFLSAIWKMG